MALIKNINDTQIKTDQGWIISVRNKPYCDVVEVWLAKQEMDRIDVCHFNNKGKMIMSKFVEGKEPEPTMCVNGRIWEGIRQAINGVAETPDKKAVDAELIATKYHLEDMRKLMKLK